MSPCRDIQPLVAARPLGVLEPDEERGVAGHLRGCADCRALLERVEETLAAGCGPEPAPPRAWDAIEARLPGAPPRAASRARPLAALAAVMVLSGAGLLWHSPAAAPVLLAPPTPAAPTPHPPPARPGAEDAAPARPRPEDAPAPPDAAPAPPDPAPVDTWRPVQAQAPLAPPAPGGVPARPLVAPPADDLRVARALLSEGRLAEAHATLDRHLATDPQSAPAWTLRARCRAAEGDDVGALADLDRALMLDPTHPLTWALRGDERLILGDPEGALNDLTRAIELDPSSGPLFFRRARAQQVLDRQDEARADLEQAAQLGHPDAILELAPGWLDEGAPADRVRAALDEAEAGLPGDDPRRERLRALRDDPRLWR